MREMQTLDLMKVYHKALDNDPQILGEKYSHASDEKSVTEIYGRILPQLGIEYSYSETDQEIIESTIPFQPPQEDEFLTREYSLLHSRCLTDLINRLQTTQSRFPSHRSEI